MLDHDMGAGHKVPTLQSVIEYIDKRLIMNIEVKAPYEDNVKVRYDYKRSISKVHALIRSF